MKITVSCENCGEPLKRYRSKSGRYYCNIICKAGWQKHQKPVTKEWLYQKYVIEKLSANEIARIVDRNPKRVWEWLRGYNIPTRKRGNESHYAITGELPAGFTFKGRKHSEKAKEKLRKLRLLDGHVPYLKNGKHWLKEPGAKPARWKGGVTPDRQIEYSKRQWKEAVKIVWKRADAKCEMCGKDHRKIDRNKEKFHIHHLYPFIEFTHLRNNPENLRLLCEKCHKLVHSNKNTRKSYMVREGRLPEWIKG